MKRMGIWGIILFVVGMAALSGCSQSPVGVDQEEWASYDRIGLEVLAGALEWDYAKTSQYFDESLTALLPEAKLYADFDELEKDLGPYVENAGISRQDRSDSDHPVMAYTLQFARGYLDLVLTFDREYQVSMLRMEMSSIVPGKERVCPPGVMEEEIAIGSGENFLPGTLSYPAESKGAVPLLILVHGSGPNDRNESLGLLRPFQDIAWGLGERGIAVLRYEKRTKVYPEEMKALADADVLTVKEEVIDDVLLALVATEAIASFEVGKVFLLGHSLGGSMLPRISQRAQDVSGYIFMAAPARQLVDMMLEQYAYLFSLEEGMTEAQKRPSWRPSNSRWML